ncbi:MotA/TolQ/ExbB proton channel family protein [Beijerinckia indica]|uniref:MotA/TolQ/ExbB proton channel n=1 Tax=Beijerinckia indica subsp. indica (strain ATCC 9039 / DSM 1715 / NCIMB 8712) TaxID=395963 RepID=B2IG29_BEII9|nr:MotA/TolQ/ExbB proton channel family protein [Beijerinckia indica]ACB95766.1 MotA/TolQ/ExbB proton channel [Beijerinckia indica subsp. indica ATCC 9039]
METLSISPLSLFEQAGPVGKAVMAILLLASVWCWVLIIEALVSVSRLKKAVRLARSGGIHPLVAPLLDAGQKAAATTIPGESVGEARIRIAEAMHRAAQTIMKKTEGGLPNLAVISSVAPFVGLFGTVWGIMTSFTGIAASKDTSLAVVAPGIAEALAATAYGLAAAIPATLGYNRIGAMLAGLGQTLSHLVEERAVMLISRSSQKSKEVA